MPTSQQLRTRLIKKLKELFQLDQPDLDFGFYRIMHAKAKQVSNFIETDLLKIVEESFGRADDARKAELQAAYEKAIETAKEFGAADPETTPPVQKARAALDALKDTASAEADIYDHLYRFFERYYDDGDFISRRYFTRETPGKAAPFAIPYNGEEVKLHWANADQYYIKTTEYFSNFTFDLKQAQEVRALSDKDRMGILGGGEEDSPLRVHFRIVEASEGDHGNVKPSDATKRFFILHAAKPVDLTDDGELVVNFEYRPDPDKTGQEGTWREKRNSEAVAAVLARLEEMVKENTALSDYIRLLKLSAPTDNDNSRTLLAKYVNQYTARNTMDYFIHKNLGDFLSRELDFYIKNEMMHLDDIESATAPEVATYLAKLKVLRKIAGKLIQFLAQLEDFQKKLWLKKKFVVETNYCITLDRVPEELYPEVITNEAQHDEWIKLFAINEIERSLNNPGYIKPLTKEFLAANNKLVLDTKFFSESFKSRLLASIENFELQCDGVLINSENFQALRMLQKRYERTFSCIYIDPPYNTDASSIIYKNSYKNSSWLSLIDNRLTLALRLLSRLGVFCLSIDDEQVAESRNVLDNIFAKKIGVAVVRSNPQSRKSKGTLSTTHEYALFYGNSTYCTPGSLDLTEKRLARYPLQDDKGRYAWMNFIRTGNNDKRSDRPKLYYPIYVDRTDNIRIPNMTWCEENSEYIIHDKPKDETVVYPITENGKSLIEKRWHRGHLRVIQEPDEFRVRRDSNGKVSIDFKTRIDEDSTPTTWWDHKEYASANYGAAELKELFGVKPFDYPKAKKLVEDCIKASCVEIDGSYVFDFFAGSGTTGNAAIDLRRKEGIDIRYVLVEMAEYFDTVLKPRIAKVVYSQDWKEGKPTNRTLGVSHCFKYLRLESYEDTLNNLIFDDNPVRNRSINAQPSLKEDYMLHYFLDVETRGSQSLLNIDAFVDPMAYALKVKKPGTDEYTVKNVDLLETFNYLIGLRVGHIAAPQRFTAEFTRLPDPELPHDQNTRLVVDGRIRQDDSGPWWFRKVEGWVPKDPATPNNGQREKVLIVWRTLTGDLERDNLMLDEWFQKNRISTRDFEFDTIYVNGSNNLPNLQQEGDTWKVRLLEEEFMKRMWDMEGV